MSDNLYKYLRIYPGLQSGTKITFKELSFESLLQLGLEANQLSEIYNRLGKFKVESIGSEGDDTTLADMDHLLATTVEAKDLYSFEKVLNPYEQVLFFIANLELAIPPIYENISFRILENGGTYPVDEPKTLRIDRYWPMNIYLSQYHFVEKDDLMSSKLMALFTNMKSEIFQRDSKQGNEQLGNQNLVASLYWYNKACKMSEHREEKSAIIYFATAFESFFYITGRSKKDSLGFAIQRYLGDNGRLRKWVNEFYEARNKIVHGSYLERSELKAVKGTNYVHSIIAKQVFQECILRQLHITEGLDYSRTEMNVSCEYIINNLLTLNEDKFNKLLNRSKFSYVTISSDESVAKDFFKTLKSINPNENYENEDPAKSIKGYHDLTKNLATIVVEWINDSKENTTFPIFYASINKYRTGIDETFDFSDELQKLSSYFDNYEPTNAKSIFTTWEMASTHFTRIFLRGFPFFLSKYKPLGIYDILDFVMSTATRLG